MKDNFFLSFFIFSDYFSSFPPFSISWLSFFLLFNPNHFFLSLLLLLNHLAVFITFFLVVILFFLLFSLRLVLFNFLFIHLCKLFSFIHLEYCSVVISFSFPFYLNLFCVFHFSKLLLCFFLQHAAILIERFGQTCMTTEQIEMLMLLNSFAVAALGRTLYVQTVTINSAQPDFDIEFLNCSCSVVRGHYSSILVSDERRWTELYTNLNYTL